ncbi:hypothetical protein Q4F19_03290 [Sphingomonas sp. BIUV-7]|uniref:Uncharacterized protein n=1 Tax=Sphingomonas natans TaxID=3063330 RepID=A0ABT8Y5X2_9SPHN|nr:hypothetical protein [Sphingomonas sp. BIUV-7]
MAENGGEGHRQIVVIGAIAMPCLSLSVAPNVGGRMARMRYGADRSARMAEAMQVLCLRSDIALNSQPSGCLPHIAIMMTADEQPPWSKFLANL